jgi:hypothetical protein
MKFSGIIALVATLCSCGDSMIRREPPALSGGAEALQPLPREVPSASALLTATHLFTFEVRTAEAPAWTFEMQERELRMELVVREVYKGTLSLAPGAPFSLVVSQRQQWRDYAGLWSNVRPEPTPGLTYLAVTEGDTSDPVALLNEPAIRLLVPAEQAIDVRLAMEAESLRRESIDHITSANEQRTSAQREPTGAVAMRRLLALTHRERARAGQLFWDYLWHRIARPFYDSRPRPVAELLEIVRDPATNTALRMEIADTLVGLTTDMDVEGKRQVTRALFELFALPPSRRDTVRLIEVSLRSLILEKGSPEPVDVVLPDPATRQTARTAIAQHDTDTTRRLLQWLNGK